MNTTMQALITEADEMAKTNNGNGTALVATVDGDVRVYRERNIKCMNMKKLSLKTSWKLNGKVISAATLATTLRDRSDHCSKQLN